MSTRPSAFLLVLLAAPAAYAPAQPPAASPRPAPAWQMDWGDYFCTLARLPGEETPFAVAFRTVPGSFSVGLNLLPTGRATLPRRISSIVLMPSGRAYDVTERIATLVNRRTVVQLQSLPDSIWGVLEGSTELHLLREGRVVRQVPLSRTEAAVRAYRQCEANAMALWGIDAAALQALSQRPASTNNFGLTSADYPMAALRSGTQGRVVVRVTVSAEGRATDCAVVSTSHSDSIDRAACRAILANGRFRIPLDAEGRPTSVRIATAITWLIGG